LSYVGAQGRTAEGPFGAGE